VLKPHTKCLKPTFKCLNLTFKCLNQGWWSGSVSGLDPDSMTLWIRIRIGNPDPGSGSRAKNMKKNKYFFSWFIFITEKYKNSTNCYYLVDFLIFEKIYLLKYCCGSGSGLDPDPDWIGSGLDLDSMALWTRIRIRIEVNLWIRIRIRIRIESIRIHNPGLTPLLSA
jgi:hypothetical protein